MIFLIVFILAAIWAASRGNKKFIIFFMAFYPILPDYFSIEAYLMQSIRSLQSLLSN